MKKLFFALVMLVSTLSITNKADAQTATLLPLVAGDTLVMSASIDSVIKTIPVTAGYSAIGIQVVLTELSGTTDCKAYLYGSLDGSNYTLTDSSAAFTDITTNYAVFTKVTAPFTYQRVVVKPIGAQTETFSGIVRTYIVLRRHD